MNLLEYRIQFFKPRNFHKTFCAFKFQQSRVQLPTFKQWSHDRSGEKYKAQSFETKVET